MLVQLVLKLNLHNYFCISVFFLNEKVKQIDIFVVSTDSNDVVTGQNGRFILKNISADNKATFHKMGYTDVILSADKIPSKLILQTAPIQIPGMQVTSLLLPTLTFQPFYWQNKIF